MALVVPLVSSASVIENILFKVRRGIALSRNASQANANTGVMVDLPEKIDFEMTLLKTHQSSSFQRVVGTTGSESGGESRTTTSSESSSTTKGSTSTDTSTSKESGGGSDSDTTTRSESETESGQTSATDKAQGADSEAEQENRAGNSVTASKEASASNGISLDSEIENRCTFQRHDAVRLYDKFDTDTGVITGISY